MSHMVVKSVPSSVSHMCVSAARLTGIAIGQRQRKIDESVDPKTIQILERRIDEIKTDFVYDLELIYIGHQEAVNILLEQMDHYAKSTRQYGCEIVI